MRIVFLSKNCRMFNSSDEPIPDGGGQPVLVVDLDRCIGCGSCKIACQLENREREGPPPGSIPTALSRNSDETLQLNLPLACRHCDTRCTYYHPYNFWITCPLHVRKQSQICNSCEGRLAKGYMPACATRCAMKCIYVCNPGDLKFPLMEKRLRGIGDLDIN